MFNSSKGFEDELSRQRADSERIKSEKNEKIDRLQTELDQATDKIGELQDDVDQKQLEGSRSKSNYGQMSHSFNLYFQIFRV